MSSRLKRLIWLLPLTLVVYLVAWPVDILPVAWNPPPAPSLEEGFYAKDDALRGVQRLADGGVVGPEAVAFDGEGRLYSGLSDGRVVQISADGSQCRVLANTGGRPAGLKVQASGSVVVADAKKGLLLVKPDGSIETWETAVDGANLGLTDDLDLDSRGRVFFSDASWKFGLDVHHLDALEHGARGRLILHDPSSKRSATLMADLQFANGVTLGPDEQYVLVNQTTDYRITRFWMKGSRSGQVETFAENLPGFPDNVTFNGTDRFWVALYMPRDPLLDKLAPIPFLRTVIARLPRSWLPAGGRQGFVIGLDLDGKVVEQYRFGGKGAYGPVTSAIERDGMLYLGSLDDTAIGRISLADLRGGVVKDPPAPVTATCEEK